MSSDFGSNTLLSAAVCLLLFFSGCGNTSGGLEDGTAEMVTRLRNIANSVNPEINSYANSKRAEYLRQIPEPAGTDDRIVYQGSIAQELIYAGDLEPAIAILNELLEEIDADPELTEKHIDSTLNLLGLAYLRMGEQQNCIINHSSASCLFPISGEGIHTLTEGSEKAMGIYERILNERRPDDMEARWLLNVAAMTLGEHPEGVPSQWVIPTEAFQSDDTIERYPDIAPYVGLANEMSLSGGSITEDFNNDGFMDVMASSWGPSDQLQFFINRGDGTFENRTAQAGLTGLTGGLNLAHADFNNDGYNDVLVLRGAWLGEAGLHPNSLLKNNGDGTFSDVTESAGLLSLHPTQTAVWSDLNNDGWLDLYIGNESSGPSVHPAELYLSNRDGTFTNIAQAAGVAVIGYIKGVTAGDFNNDGLQDLYVSRLGGTNMLFRNEGLDENGIPGFLNVASQAGVSEPMESFPTWFWDYNNDGWLDIFVSAYNATPGDVAREYLGEPFDSDPPALYRNNGDGTFTDVAVESGLNTVLLTMGSNFGDLDNNGYPDFYAGTGDPGMQTIMPNRMFRNHDGTSFKEVTTTGGFGHLQKGHGVSFADMENDGTQDIFTVMGGAFEGDVYQNSLFRNPGHDNNWITLIFEGTTSNRNGIGNRVTITVETATGEKTFHHVVTTGGSFGSSSLQLEAGLGDADRISELTVHWPASNTDQVFRGIDVNRFYQITEGNESLTPLEREQISLHTSH